MLQVVFALEFYSWIWFNSFSLYSTTTQDLATFSPCCKLNAFEHMCVVSSILFYFGARSISIKLCSFWLSFIIVTIFNSTSFSRLIFFPFPVSTSFTFVSFMLPFLEFIILFLLERKFSLMFNFNIMALINISEHQVNQSFSCPFRRFLIVSLPITAQISFSTTMKRSAARLIKSEIQVSIWAPWESRTDLRILSSCTSRAMATSLAGWLYYFLHF